MVLHPTELASSFSDGIRKVLLVFEVRHQSVVELIGNYRELYTCVPIFRQALFAYPFHGS